jgi:hypothetical protein
MSYQPKFGRRGPSVHKYLAGQSPEELKQEEMHEEPRQVTEAEADYEDGYDDVQSLG